MTDAALVLETSAETRTNLERCLRGLVRLEFAHTTTEAMRLLSDGRFTLVFVDDSLTRERVYDFCSSLKAEPCNPALRDLPVLFLSSDSSPQEAVNALSAGFDDFIRKPFDRNELRARTEAKLRRSRWERARSRAIRFEGLEIDIDEQKVVIHGYEGPEEVRLTPLEFKVLTLLAKEPLRVFSREEILEAIWGKDIHVYGRTVDTYVSKLRKKLGPKADYVDSIHSVGYRLLAPMDVVPLQNALGGRELFQGVIH